MIRPFFYLAIILISAFLISPVYAHTVVMSVEDNEDGTVTIEGVYSTQEIPVGAEVRLEDEKGKELAGQYTERLKMTRSKIPASKVNKDTCT